MKWICIADNTARLRGYIGKGESVWVIEGVKGERDAGTEGWRAVPGSDRRDIGREGGWAFRGI